MRLSAFFELILGRFDKKFWDAEFVFRLFRLMGLIFIISSDGIISRQVWIWDWIKL